MPALLHDITIEVGAEFVFALEWRESDGVTPIDLSGYAARMQVRRHYTDAEALLSFTSAPGGGIELGGVTGSIVVRASAALTSTLPLDDRGFVHGVYDIEMEKDGVVTRLVQGRARITSEVTR